MIINHDLGMDVHTASALVLGGYGICIHLKPHKSMKTGTVEKARRRLNLAVNFNFTAWEDVYTLTHSILNGMGLTLKERPRRREGTGP